MILRQTFRDPSNNRVYIKEIELRLEDVRLPGETHPRIRILGFCNELSSLAEPVEQVGIILDSKRTYVPNNVFQTRLASYYKNNVMEVYDAAALNAKPGDPLVVMKGNDKFYVFVKQVDENKLGVMATKDFEAPAGSVIQNLSNRHWQGTNEVGIVAKMTMPDKLSFAVSTVRDGIVVMVTSPLNSSNVSGYDVYVRDHKFDKVGADWWPDAMDVSFDHDQYLVNTYNGGRVAGGGDLSPGECYYVTAISKEGKGFNNVNESSPSVEKIMFHG